MNRDIICWDLETTGKNPQTCQVTQIAAMAIDPRNFKVKGTFNTETRAIVDDAKAIAAGFGPIEEGALKVTGKTREQIDAAPDLEVSVRKFMDFINKYNYKKSTFFAPISAGFNTNGYDLPILDRMCKQFNIHWDEKRQQQNVFSPIYRIDVMQEMLQWTEGDPAVKSVSLDKLREWMGMSKDNAHDALQDVKDTANIMIKLMKTRRAVYKNLVFKDTFKDGGLYVT